MEHFYDDAFLDILFSETNKKVSKMTKPAWTIDKQLSIQELKMNFALDLYTDIVQ